MLVGERLNGLIFLVYVENARWERNLIGGKRFLDIHTYIIYIHTYIHNKL